MFDFHWQVPENGYEWVRAKLYKPKHVTEEEEYLVEIGQTGRFDPRHPVAYRTDEPLRHSALFKVFVEVNPTPDGILVFANKYGTLGGGARKAVVTAEFPYHPANGQPFWFWRREILAMRHTVAIWEAIKRGDSGFLSKHIQWSTPRGAGQMSGFTFATPTGWKLTLTSLRSMPEIDAMLAPGDPILPARVGIHERVNEKLRISSLVPKLAWGRIHGKLRERIHFVVGDLISALWLQLSRAIEGDLEYSQCDECAGWYEVSGDRRADARFCSDPCRFRAYRKRQKEAMQLHGARVSPKDIAKQLGSDVKTVKGWIAKGK